jgi:hypothetical protein
MGLQHFHIQVPFFLQFQHSSAKQIVSISCTRYIYFHGNDSKQNHKVISELFTTTIQSLLLIQLSIGMNSSLHTHVLSANIFFLLSRNIFITLSPQQRFSVIYHYVASLTCNFLVVISNSS